MLAETLPKMNVIDFPTPTPLSKSTSNDLIKTEITRAILVRAIHILYWKLLQNDYGEIDLYK